MDLERLILHWFAGVGLGVAMVLVALVFAVFGVPLSFIALTGQLTVLMLLTLFAFVALAFLFGYLGVLARNILYGESEVELGLEEIPRLWLHGVLLVLAMMLLITILGIFGLAISLTLFGSILENSIALFIILGFIVIATVFGWVNFEITERFY